MERADIIVEILNKLLSSKDIDKAIMKLSNIIAIVNSEDSLPLSTSQEAYSQELPSHL
jgi:hypothetical protein